MILITCVDDDMGMSFNNHRQSRDRTVTDRIGELRMAGLYGWTHTPQLYLEAVPSAYWQTTNVLHGRGKENIVSSNGRIRFHT